MKTPVKKNEARHHKKSRSREGKWVILSLGGSLIVPGEIDTKYLKKLRQTILGFHDYRFVVVCGGGVTSRRYISAAKGAGAKPTNDDLDWIGIHAINLNAALVRLVFGKDAHSRVIRRLSEYQGAPKTRVVVAGAYQPGNSSDLNAVRWAEKLGASKVINLTNVDHVYTANPKTNKRAKPLKSLTWDAYLKIIGGRWIPGLNTPFDPLASQMAKRQDIEVAILDGRKLDEVKKAITGKNFTGTLLRR